MPSACAKFIPERWRVKVEGAEPYEDTAAKGEVTAFGVAQTYRLEEANSRTLDTITIVETCEREHAMEAAKLTRKKFLGLF